MNWMEVQKMQDQLRELDAKLDKVLKHIGYDEFAGLPSEMYTVIGQRCYKNEVSAGYKVQVVARSEKEAGLEAQRHLTRTEGDVLLDIERIDKNQISDDDKGS